MESKDTHPNQRPEVAQRTRLVWIAFASAMSIVGGLLAISDRESSQAGFLAANLATAAASAEIDPILGTSQPLDRNRWKSIVIHHLGAPVGDPETIHRQHQALGQPGLGFHFLIGNGSGLGDGIVHVGYRWTEQRAGAHALGPDAAFHNEHSIAICLIGNGDRRPFTDSQISQLIALVNRLQRELGIPAEAVYLHREIAGVSSPGRYFPAAMLEEQLR